MSARRPFAIQDGPSRSEERAVDAARRHRPRLRLSPATALADGDDVRTRLLACKPELASDATTEP